MSEQKKKTKKASAAKAEPKKKEQQTAETKAEGSNKPAKRKKNTIELEIPEYVKDVQTENNNTNFNYKGIFHENDEKWTTVDWGKYFSHVYNVRANENNEENDRELERVGLLGNPVFSFHYADLAFDQKKVRYFKKKAIVDCVNDAKEKGYDRIFIFTDDVKFIFEATAKEILEKTSTFNLALLNTYDICEDCIAIDKAAINLISAIDFDYANNNWVNDIRGYLRSDVSLSKTYVTVPMCMHKIDFVFPFVDGSDPVWIKQNKKDSKDYEGFANKVNRFRSWDNIQYIFRGIEKNMEYVNNVYLIVSGDSQVPEWANTEKIRVLKHSDFIPEQHLPLYNSCTIEMFLGKIKGLSEYFVYSNDDVFITGRIPFDRAYTFGVPNLSFEEFELNDNNMYEHNCKNSLDIVAREFGDENPKFIKPAHGMAFMLKSTWGHLYSRNEKAFGESVTMFRDFQNINQYVEPLFNKYYYGESGRILNTYYYQAYRDNIIACHTILSQSSQIVCLNDNTEDETNFKACRNNINKCLDQILPDKSSYEK